MPLNFIICKVFSSEFSCEINYLFTEHILTLEYMLYAYNILLSTHTVMRVKPWLNTLMVSLKKSMPDSYNLCVDAVFLRSVGTVYTGPKSVPLPNLLYTNTSYPVYHVRASVSHPIMHHITHIHTPKTHGTLTTKLTKGKRCTDAGTSSSKQHQHR